MPRYIVVEEPLQDRETPIFCVYEKGWMFNTFIKLFIDKQDAINFTLRLIKAKPIEKKVVFDSKKDLSMDIHF